MHRLPTLALALALSAAPVLADAPDPQWLAALAGVHEARKAAHEVATMKIYMPTVQDSVHAPRLEAIRERLSKPPAAAVPLSPGAAQRRWQCLDRYRFQLMGHVMRLNMASLRPSESVREGLAKEELDPAVPGCAGVLREAGDEAVTVLTVSVTNVGHPKTLARPCLFQGTVLEVEKGRAMPGKPIEFRHDCVGDPGHAGTPLRLRFAEDGAILSAEILDAPTKN